MKKKSDKIVFNIADYDYMDALKLDGWCWEFARRREKYKKTFSIIDDYVSNRKSLEDEPEDTFLIKNLLRIESTLIRPHITDKALSSQKYLSFQFPESSFFQNVPHPRFKFTDFKDEKPFIIGMKLVTSHSIDKSIYVDFNKNRKNSEKKEIYYRYCHEIINSSLPVKSPLDTLFVGISMRAKKEDIIEQLNDLVKNRIKTPYKAKAGRQDEAKWKYYLMVYDLKYDYGDALTYAEIADTMSAQYNESVEREMKRLRDEHIDEKHIANYDQKTKNVHANLIIEKNITNYYREAKKLINGGYKKFVVGTGK